MTKKIAVNKSDEIAVVVEKLMDAESKEVVLSIPRFSNLAESLSNFHLLKREADSLKKKLIIESVDDRVIELAELSGLKATNPFFSKNKKRFSDITAPSKKNTKEPSKKFFSDAEEETGGSFKLEVSEEPEKREKSITKFLRSWSFPKMPEISGTGLGERLVNFKNRIPWKVSIIAILVISIFWILAKELPRATIVIAAKKADWSYSDSIIADKSARLDSANLTIPSQVFIQKKNLELKFPATGRKQIERSATGKIIVYNSYSSDPQQLIEKTRFISPDGKLFRLVKTITVPGAKIVDGKIIPSSIETSVIADQPGPDYNIGPVKIFTIPGFKGGPKYQAFYGESKESMAGGFIGEAAYPTANDIKNAQTEIRKSLEDGLRIAAFSQIPKGFKILDDAVSFSLLNQTVREESDSNNNFSVFAEGQMTLIGFLEEDLFTVLTGRAIHDRGEEFEVINKELKYGLARTDLARGKMSFLVDFKAGLKYRISSDALRDRIIGRREEDLKSIIFAVPGVESAEVSLWPFWVNKVPGDTDKVKITID